MTEDFGLRDLPTLPPEKGYTQTPTGDVLVLDNRHASLTSSNGTNNRGLTCGRSGDLSGVAHGIVAKIGNHAAAPVFKERANTAPARPQQPQSCCVNLQENLFEKVPISATFFPRRDFGHGRFFSTSLRENRKCDG